MYPECAIGFAQYHSGFIGIFWLFFLVEIGLAKMFGQNSHLPVVVAAIAQKLKKLSYSLTFRLNRACVTRFFIPFLVTQFLLCFERHLNTNYKNLADYSQLNAVVKSKIVPHDFFVVCLDSFE